MNPTLRAGVFSVGGAAHVAQRHGSLESSFVVALKRQADNRARFQLDARAVVGLEIAVGDRLLCSLDFTDGEIAFAIDVYAVHDGGFVDVRGFNAIDDELPDAIRLRRFSADQSRAAHTPAKDCHP